MEGGSGKSGSPSEAREESQGQPGQGFAWEGEDLEELAQVVEIAFDYRGDVTLRLRSGEEVTGYLFNRVRDGSAAYVELFLADGSKLRLAYAEIRGIALSGKDPASGKSWETWVRNYRAKKAARERGEDVGTIGLFPEKLE